MIAVNEPLLGERELEYVTECIKTGWISSAGHFIEEFEEKWATYCGMAHGIAVSNGTTALQVAIGCLDLKPVDEVIMPTFTIISCALAISSSHRFLVFSASDIIRSAASICALQAGAGGWSWAPPPPA